MTEHKATKETVKEKVTEAVEAKEAEVSAANVEAYSEPKDAEEAQKNLEKAQEKYDLIQFHLTEAQKEVTAAKAAVAKFTEA